jgi:hypothetical protein
MLSTTTEAPAKWLSAPARKVSGITLNGLDALAAAA